MNRIFFLIGLLPLLAPDEGPRLVKYEGTYAYGLAVAPPWKEGGVLVINFPEHLEYESRGMGILRHNDATPRGRWETAPDGRRATLNVESPTAPGVRVEGEAKIAGPDRVELMIRIVNGGKIALATVKPLYCMHYRELSGFPQWVDNFKHTFVLRGGKTVALSEVPTKTPETKIKGGTIAGCDQQDNGFAERNGGLIERGLDAAIAAVEDLQGRRRLVVAWSPGKSILSNANIPCLHADPFYGTLEPGQSAEARGVLLFTEKPAEEACAQLRREGWGAAVQKK